VPHDDRLLTKPFTVAFAANLLHGLSFFLFIHLPRYLSDLGAGAVEIGVIIGVTAVAAIVIRPALGRIMDTRGRRPVMLVGGALNSVVALLYLGISAIGPPLYLVRIIHGFGIGMTFTSMFTYGADVIPLRRRTEGLALFGVSGLLPVALGGVIGEIVLGRSDFTALFLASASLSALGFVATTVLPERGQLVAEGERHGGFVRAVWQPQLLPIWAVTTAFAIALTGYFTFLRTFVDETGIGSVGLFFACYAGIAIALRIAFAWLPERIGRKRVLFPAFSLLVAGFFVLAQAGSSVDVAVAGALCGGGHAYAFPILMGFAVDRATDKGRGSAVAFFTALFDVGTLIGGPLLGTIIEVSGYTTMYLAVGVFLAGCAAGFAKWDQRYDRPAAPSHALH
jgi:MFS family permease